VRFPVAGGPRVATALIVAVLFGAPLSALVGAGPERAADRTGEGVAVRAAGSTVEPVYIPAGVIDGAGRIGCLRTPSGGVETVDLVNGRTLWRSAPPSRALLVDAERAFVLEERTGRSLRVVAHAARDGQLIRAYDLPGLNLPPWASLAEPGAERESTSFQVAARLEGDRLEVQYDATLRRVYGIRPPGVDDRVEGTAWINLDSGHADPRPGPGPPAASLFDPQAALPGVRFISAHARVPDARLMLGGPPPNVDGALVVGDRRFGFEMSPDAKVVTVHRWSASGRGDDQPLRLEHGQTTDAVWVTLDRLHLLLRRATHQRWYDLYALDSGALIGAIEAPADVAVAGHRIFWTALDRKGRLVLHATETESGRIVWRRAVRDPDPLPGAPIP